MIEMHSKYDKMHINGMFYAFFALIIMFYYVKIACYHIYYKERFSLMLTLNFLCVIHSLVVNQGRFLY